METVIADGGGGGASFVNVCKWADKTNDGDDNGGNGAICDSDGGERMSELLAATDGCISAVCEECEEWHGYNNFFSNLINCSFLYM